MNIVIAGGRDQADFLIGFLKSKKHKLVIINEDRAYCEYLSGVHGLPIINGDPCKQYILDDAYIRDFDVLIALTDRDEDNLAICQTAKKLYGIKRAVCTVQSPKSVEVFKKLGVNTVISAAYIAAKMIEQASTVENLIKTLSIDDGRVLMSELAVNDSFYAVNKKISELSFPPNAIISCIIRGADMFVPNGQTEIKSGDRLLIVSSLQNQDKTIAAVSTAPAEAAKQWKKIK